MIEKQKIDSGYAIEASGLTFKIGGHTVLDIPLLQIYENEVFVLLGPNGSGKSTLILCLALLNKLSAGTISYNGTPVTGAAQTLQIHRKIAVVFQDPLLLNDTVWDNINLGLRLRGVKGSEAEGRVNRWLERFGISHLAKRQARKLSGGESKRVSLARAFVLDPSVMFLDEPFDALDAPTRRGLLEDFREILHETNVTVVMVTHDRNEALALADRVGVLIDGSMRQIGTPKDIFGFPVDDAVAKFVEAGNVFYGVVGSQIGGLATVHINGQKIIAVSELPEGSQVAVYLQYDDITITLPSSSRALSSARNQLVGRIVRTVPSLSQHKVTADCGFPLSAVITGRSFDELGLGIGKDIALYFKASAVRLILRN